MTKTIELDVALAKLSEIVAGLGPGEEIVLVHNHHPVARILPAKGGKPRFGSCAGLLTVVAEDDEHLEQFAEYMP